MADFKQWREKNEQRRDEPSHFRKCILGTTGLSPAPWSWPFRLSRIQFPSVCTGTPRILPVAGTDGRPLTNRTASSLNSIVYGANSATRVIGAGRDEPQCFAKRSNVLRQALWSTPGYPNTRLCGQLRGQLRGIVCVEQPRFVRLPSCGHSGEAVTISA